jgi:large subunit ribosomal protein L5
MDILHKCGVESPHALPTPTHCIVHTMPGGDVATILAGGVATTLLTGQRPGWTRAHRAMAGFRLREHQLLGCRVTLRGTLLWRYIHRYMEMSLPRDRGFVGLVSWDTHGVWSMGCQDLLLFPELEHMWHSITGVGGLDIHMCSTSTHRERTMCLWSAYVPVKTE